MIGLVTSLFAVRVALTTWMVVAADHEWLVGKIPDDAFYYFEIGTRIARGEGATFDGLHGTNGFHPLWQMVVSGLAFLFQGDALVKAALVVELACMALTVVIVARIVRDRFGTWAAAGALLVGSTSAFLGLARDGMESGLTVLLLALVIRTLIAYLRAPSRATALLLGFCCGALVLTRLDFATVVWIVPVVMVWRGRAWRRAIQMCVAAAASVTLYLIWNLARFGHLLSVSGARKLQMMDGMIESSYGSRFSWDYLGLVRSNAEAIVADANNLANPGWWGDLHLVTIVALTGFVLWATRRLPASNDDRTAEEGSQSASIAFLAVAAMIVFRGVIDLAILPVWAASWYGVSLVVLGALVLVTTAIHTWQALLGQIKQSRLRVSMAAVGVTGFVAVLVFVPFDVPADSRGLPSIANSWQVALDETAAWLDDNPQSGRLGAYDAGLLGFELDPVSIVNLDGLVNDYQYAELLADGTVSPVDRYSHVGVDVLIGRFVAGDERLPECATELWTSSQKAWYANDMTGQVTATPVGVYSLDRCLE